VTDLELGLHVMDHPAWRPIDLGDLDEVPDGSGKPLAAWIVDPLQLALATTATASLRVGTYQPGTWGPEAIAELIGPEDLVDELQLEDLDLPVGPSTAALWRFAEAVDPPHPEDPANADTAVVVHESLAVFMPVPSSHALIVLATSNHSLATAVAVRQPLLELAHLIDVGEPPA
jgi:hypothetical protein